MSGAADWYARQVLTTIPRVLTLQDRDPASPTYGSFDRNWWHYRTQDFPSGMYQELALPLAQVYAFDLPDNPWKGQPRIRDLALAGVRASARTAHADGSCDDYFPHERALGAAAFCAAAQARVLDLTGARDDDLLAFCLKRARWLVGRQESGRLSNHQALVALAAARTGRLCADEALMRAAHERLALCLSWQHPEGWFQEYEGADLGYQSLTVSFLAALREEFTTPELDRALARALAFSRAFLHPDGSYGGEYGSRNTCQTLPAGWEALAEEDAHARALADGWLAGARAGRRGHSDDDRIVSHALQDHAEAWRHRTAREARGAGPASSAPPPAGVTSFPGAHLHVVRAGSLTVYLASNKGGTLRAHRDERCIASDTGIVVVLGDGARAVMHVVDPDARVAWREGGVAITGTLHAARRRVATPSSQFVFRLINATLGRIAPDLQRRLLQRLLITGKAPLEVRFVRDVDWSDGVNLVVTDRLESPRPWPEARRVLASTDATSIYVATSNVWQEASLECWTEHDDALRALRSTGVATIRRERS